MMFFIVQSTGIDIDHVHTYHLYHGFLKKYWQIFKQFWGIFSVQKNTKKLQECPPVFHQKT